MHLAEAASKHLEFREFNHHFHFWILKASGNLVLLEHRERVRLPLPQVQFRRFFDSTATASSNADHRPITTSSPPPSPPHHHLITAAIIDGKSSTAEKLMRRREVLPRSRVKGRLRLHAAWFRAPFCAHKFVELPVQAKGIRFNTSICRERTAT